MEKTCTVQGAFNRNKVLQGFDDFNRNLEFLTDVTFFDFSKGCTNLNNTVYNFQPCNILVMLTKEALAHYLCPFFTFEDSMIHN